MTWFILLIGLVALVMAWFNRARVRQTGEDIDEIRNSLYELRTALKTLRAEWNIKISKLHTEILKLKDEIPRDRTPYHITRDCIACGSCMPECPTRAITEGPIFEISPALCIACGKCAKICPVNACQELK